MYTSIEYGQRLVTPLLYCLIHQIEWFLEVHKNNMLDNDKFTLPDLYLNVDTENMEDIDEEKLKHGKRLSYYEREEIIEYLPRMVSTIVKDEFKAYVKYLY